MIATAERGGRRGASLAGRARIALRLGAMVVVLGGCLVLYYATRALRLPNPWPPRFLAAIAWLAGARVTVFGSPMRTRALLLANHVSWLDIPILAGASGTAFVAHSGLADNAVLRWLCRMNDTVFVARTRRGTVAEQAGQVRAALGEQGALAIFPEGTTSDGTGLLPFKSALLAAIEPAPAGLVVQPVLIDYGRAAPEIAWIGDEEGGDNFLRILARAGSIPVRVHFLEPFAPGAIGGRKAIAAEARARIAAALPGPPGALQ